MRRADIKGEVAELVEGGILLRCCMAKSYTEGSNPSLSANWNEAVSKPLLSLSGTAFHQVLTSDILFQVLCSCF